MEWHRRRWAGSVLRLAGAASLAIGAMLWHALFGPPARPADALAALLALLAFASTSAGSAMLAMGAHLFDQIPLSPRWTRRL